VLLLATWSGGCGVLLSTKVARPPAVHEFSGRLRLHDEELTLHLASPSTPLDASTPLILYASGDGGWFGAAVGMFRTIAGSGLPTVGISTKAFMRIEHRWSKPLSVAHVAESYRQIIDAARAQLRLLPDAPVVLTGWSRGASLGVLVASEGDTAARVVGLVAVGLAADEQLDIEGDDDDPVSESLAPAAAGDDAGKGSIAMYPLLSHLGPRRSVVIQASGDGYLPGARARMLFGPDKAMSRLVVIDARNHRFSGGESSFATALVNAVTWVSSSAAESR
jgi:pimeloyl-ACP methyl ester carboxylesterase